MEERALGWLRNGVVAALALAFVAGIFLPVYTDEVGWRFQERAAIDGVDKLYTDICGANTLAVPPLFMMPVRYFSAYMNTWFADPFYVRVSGILYALLWLALVLKLICRIAPERTDRAVLGVCAAGLMGLATLPLLLVWSRPEQPLLLALAGALLLALAQPWPGENSGPVPGTPVRTAWWRSLGILALAAIALSYHLKALFLVPVFLGCLCLASRGRPAWLPRITVGAMLVALTASAAHYWVHRLGCPDDPILRATFDAHNMGGELLRASDAGAVIDLIGKLFANIDLFPYIEQTLPFTHPMSAWLPNGQIDTHENGQWGLLVFTAWYALTILTFIGLMLAIWRSVAGRTVDPRLCLALLILGIVIALSATQTIRNTYEVILVVPLLMLVVVLVLSATRFSGVLLAARNVVAVLVGLGAIVSIAVTAQTWQPSLARSNAQSGYIKQQPYSLPVFGYAALEPEILATARLCNIPPPDKARALMIDDLTYFTFMESRLPQHRLGIFGMWKGRISDPIAYLKSRGSDGIIIGCHLMPEKLRGRAKRRGAFCCLGPPNW